MSDKENYYQLSSFMGKIWAFHSRFFLVLLFVSHLLPTLSSNKGHENTCLHEDNSKRHGVCFPLWSSSMQVCARQWCEVAVEMFYLILSHFQLFYGPVHLFWNLAWTQICLLLVAEALNTFIIQYNCPWRRLFRNDLIYRLCLGFLTVLTYTCHFKML